MSATPLGCVTSDAAPATAPPDPDKRLGELLEEIEDDARVLATVVLAAARVI